MRVNYPELGQPGDQRRMYAEGAILEHPSGVRYQRIKGRWVVIVLLLALATPAWAQPSVPGGLIFGKYWLVVTKAGTGAGTGTITGPGINCGTDCSEAFLPDTEVTLSATPDTISTTFDGWSGACTGVGTCIVTLSTTRSVTATFSGVPNLRIAFQDNAPDVQGINETSFTLERCTIVSPATSCTDFAFLISLPAVSGSGSQVNYVDPAPGASCYRSKALATDLPDSSYSNTGCWP